MIRKRGCALRENRIIYRGEFTRKKRCSFLCFLGINGNLEFFSNDGTFDRLKFVRNLLKVESVHHIQVNVLFGFWMELRLL